MNILFLTNEYSHPNLPASGGSGSFISHISKILVQRGHKVYVIGVYKERDEIDDFGVKIKFINSLFKKNCFTNLARSVSSKIAFLSSFRKYLSYLEKKVFANDIYKYIKTNKLEIDIIESVDFYGFSLYLDDRIPYVVRCHGCTSVFRAFYNYNTIEDINCEFDEGVFKTAKNIIFISQCSKKWFQEIFNLKNHPVIYNGIDTELFKINNDSYIIDKSIFYFGKITIAKGADIAIKVFLEILKKEPQSTLHFIGSNESYAHVINEIIIDANIQDRVFFYGNQDTTHAINLLSKAHVVVFPSKGETFGLALCEVMSLGKPVIVSNIPSFNEIVEHNVNGFIANTVEEYIKYIQLVFNNDEKSIAISEKARKTIVEKFNIENTINETIAYYEDVIKHKTLA